MGSDIRTIEPTKEGTALMAERFERFMEQVEAQKPWWKSQEKHD